MPFSHKVGNQGNCRTFIGGSDARIIMGSDEAALVRLWGESAAKCTLTPSSSQIAFRRTRHTHGQRHLAGRGLIPGIALPHAVGNRYLRRERS